MFCDELRRQGIAQAHAVEDRRAHGALWLVLQEDRVSDGQQGADLLGKIKEIKDYTQSFRIDFEQKVWFKQAGEAKKKPYSVNVYLSKKLIDNYRKRKAFLEEIKHAIDSDQELFCFFYG